MSEIKKIQHKKRGNPLNWMYNRDIDPQRILWYFFNHCFLGRTSIYQPRKLGSQKELKEKRNWKCSCCSAKINNYVLWQDQIVCPACKIIKENYRLSAQRKENIRNAVESAEQFNDLLKECDKLGTCDIIASHHELLINDNNRLKTEFMLDLICRNNYDDKWNEIMKESEARQDDLRNCLKTKNLVTESSVGC